MMMAVALDGPDPKPALAAVETCNREAVATIVRDEPDRRLHFAAAAYAEAQAIAQARVALVTPPSTPATPAVATPAATPAVTSAQLDARQKRLDDAQAVEKSWRELIEELRTDFLAKCMNGKHDVADR
ncbi:MAG: hypothetical protein KGQ42_02195 [Alphaproteobacteria bacterium]|nr:hypothetical protein [Alphaproteobacteria bacterium]MDE2042684.1 hypothetical protein [Alphaproteobacteria bacterium]MDE2340304.1 hypothetical protein [Alphaproteobacteria bacterium]